jgi:cytochrome b6-f complex iron-sulfur subunit
MSEPNANTPGSEGTPSPKPASALPPAPTQPDLTAKVEASPAAAKPAVPVKPATPPKPATAAKPAAGSSRRMFVSLFTWINLGWFSVGAWGLGALAGTVRFMFANVNSDPPSKVDVGQKDQYEDGKVVERYKDQNMWIVRYQGFIYALSTTCTHLGCTPNWLEREEKFKCPCHGSGFKITGINFEGPAPRPLERWAIGVREDGDIIVDKSRKFQWERGEWDNPDSFIKV